MAKILTDHELLDAVTRIITDKDLVSSQDTYRQFLGELADAVCTAMGGRVGLVQDPSEDPEAESWYVAISDPGGDYGAIPEFWNNYDPEGEL